MDANSKSAPKPALAHDARSLYKSVRASPQARTLARPSKPNGEEPARAEGGQAPPAPAARLDDPARLDRARHVLLRAEHTLGLLRSVIADALPLISEAGAELRELRQAVDHARALAHEVEP